MVIYVQNHHRFQCFKPPYKSQRQAKVRAAAAALDDHVEQIRVTKVTAARRLAITRQPQPLSEGEQSNIITLLIALQKQFLRRKTWLKSTSPTDGSVWEVLVKWSNERLESQNPSSMGSRRHHIQHGRIAATL
ncbi:hypothetical protein E4U43_005172 [Claviceps pusilla]|uniref:Uncharacterized protein n=1 Tax=Claviceps pusilla TaxID=123648 RepID=A0A9P7T2N4_9HYPO|nr:hypothetical protein E4U43_005172 [Claviceps pusilla]